MGFLSLLEVASMPTLQMLIISLFGAFMATDYLKLLPVDARRSINKIVFSVFTPSLVFASLAGTVNLQDIILWWFMPVNIGITFLVGGILGWIAVKILKPETYMKELVIAMCSAGNLGNILLIVIPAICKEDGSPFGDRKFCTNIGLSYVSFSMALGACYLWTHTFHLIKSAGVKYRLATVVAAEESTMEQPNRDLEASEKSLLLHGSNATMWDKTKEMLHQLGEELLAPPVVAAIAGLVFGSISWLHNLIIGESAPLRVINDSIELLGSGTLPCITLILGGNLKEGFQRARVNLATILTVICVKFIIVPAVGIGVVQAATWLGFLPPDPLYKFVLMLQFTVPPAMNIGTMTQLLDVAQEECSVLLLWTYLVAAVALTAWSTVFMWILS